jgi:hypothetical protein
MSDYGTERSQRLYYERYLANVTPPTIAVNVSITTSSTAAALANVPAGLWVGGRYGIAAAGIPASTSFVYQGSANIALSQAATATNAAAASTISVIVG